MKVSGTFFFLLYITIFVVDSSELVQSNRTAKFFGIGLVRFENGVCTSADGLQGTCLTRRQCRKIDGIGSSSCAKGIGVCCIVQKGCGEKTSQNNTYFVSPNYPNTLTTSKVCTLAISKESSDICQARIDFLTLNLAQPDINGNCVNDALAISGGASPVPVICGENSGQHVYVDFDGNTDILATVYAGSTTLLGKRWNIKVSQIACNCPWKAPSGCLMFYNTISGTIKSLNYGTTGTSTGTRQISNENYGICINEQPGFCSITYAANAGMYSFAVSNDTNLAAGSGLGTAAAALTGANCTTDFVVIPNAKYDETGLAVDSDRFCGNGFETVTTESKPFVVTVVTDSNELDDAGNRGFSLGFTQKACTNGIFG